MDKPEMGKPEVSKPEVKKDKSFMDQVSMLVQRKDSSPK
jgi:hypothetical protein